MPRLIAIVAALSTLTTLALPAAAADRGVAVRGDRAVVVSRMHYYDPYPWWWHPPYVQRARTNYQPWPYAVRDPAYNLPHPGGVIGYRVL